MLYVPASSYLHLKHELVSLSVEFWFWGLLLVLGFRFDLLEFSAAGAGFLSISETRL